MNNRLNLLLRKNRGKKKKEKCENLFFVSGFNVSDLLQIELDKSDEILLNLKKMFNSKDIDYEIIESVDYQDSSLLMKIINEFHDSNSFVYTVDCQDCGMYLTKTDIVIKNILTLAKNDYQNTCFAIDENLKYSLTLTYNDETHSTAPCVFDIQLWMR